MEQNNILNKIADIEREISLLPEGGIAKKNIKGHVYYYHRITRNGKRIENYIDFNDVPDLERQIAIRKKYEKELRLLKQKIKPEKSAIPASGKAPVFHTLVRYGKPLEAQVSTVAKYRERDIIGKLRDYVSGPQQDKVFILYGLRRTGKTTMIRQILSELSASDFKKAAFLQVTSKNTLADVNSDLRVLEDMGFKYIFIDEVTLLEDFIEGAAVFSDIYASSGMKIVLSGTDSLGFLFSKSEQLYDRCIMLHTTFISYREFEEIIGIQGIDEYIRYGGTMSLGGTYYQDTAPFSSQKNAKEYIDTAIARNIQHSLRMYQYGGHFRSLVDLYEKGELTNAINRVVEDINHRFTKNIVERTFKSNDIAITASNLLRDKKKPVNIAEHMDIGKITKGIMHMLDILNKEEQSIDINETHMLQIREYLSLLDLIMEIDLEFIPPSNQRRSITVISQPGLRYAQAEAIISNILLDSGFQEFSITERQRILERLLSEVRGRMMEEIVLLETKLANPDKHIFKLQFAVGEYDMVVFNPKDASCRLYEIKYSKERVPEQSRHLTDEEKCAAVRHRYGTIKGKYIIYRGKTIEAEEIKYLNVEQYLKSIPDYS